EALAHGEERLLGGIGDDRDDQLVEDSEAALDEVAVAVVHGIEHPRIDRTLGHASSSGRRNTRRRCYPCARKKVKASARRAANARDHAQRIRGFASELLARAAV